MKLKHKQENRQNENRNVMEEARRKKERGASKKARRRRKKGMGAAVAIKQSL